MGHMVIAAAIKTDDDPHLGPSAPLMDSASTTTPAPFRASIALTAIVHRGGDSHERCHLTTPKHQTAVGTCSLSASWCSAFVPSFFHTRAPHSAQSRIGLANCHTLPDQLPLLYIPLSHTHTHTHTNTHEHTHTCIYRRRNKPRPGDTTNHDHSVSTGSRTRHGRRTRCHGCSLPTISSSTTFCCSSTR